MSAVLLRERKQKELFQKHEQNSASKHLIVETEENDKVSKKAEINRQRNRAVVWRNGNAVEDGDGFGLKEDYSDDICEDEVGRKPSQKGYMWSLLPCLLKKVKSAEIGKRAGFKLRVRSNFDGSVKTNKEGSFCVVEVEVVDFGEGDTVDTFTDCYCALVTDVGKLIQLSEVTPKPPASAIKACKQLKKFDV